MLELEAALAQILQVLPTPFIEEVGLPAAYGRVLAETVRSSINLPPFDNSAMDGYAVRASDVAKANKDAPARLKIIGKAAAGEIFAGSLAEGTCVRLFTGSPLPHGADAVVMQEDTRPAGAESVEVMEPVKPWENTRLQGEDIKQGTVLAKAGDVLRTGAMALLSGAGYARANVGQKPTVGLLATGSELVEPGTTLLPGKIYESNRIGLAALVTRAGGVSRIFPIVADTLEGTRLALYSALDACDILVTSGGVSVGEMDFIKPALQELGGSLEFWKVAIKPGRPFVFGQAQGKLLFGLPGNPISALVTFLLLVRPAILRWQGATDINLPVTLGTLVEPLANSGERRHFMRVKLDHAGNVRSAGLQASHALSSMAAANGLVDVPSRTTMIAGTVVNVMLWE